MGDGVPKHQQVHMVLVVVDASSAAKVVKTIEQELIQRATLSITRVLSSTTEIAGDVQC